MHTKTLCVNPRFGWAPDHFLVRDLHVPGAVTVIVSLTWNGFSFPHLSRSNPTHRAQPRSWLFSEAFATAYRDPIFHSPPSPSAPHTRTVTGHLIFSCFVLMSLLFHNASILALQNHKLNGQFLHIAGLLLISLNK